MGWFCCIRTSPIALPEASVSRSNGIEKFGMAKVRAVVMACLSVSKADWASGFQRKASFLRREVRGVAMAA